MNRKMAFREQLCDLIQPAAVGTKPDSGRADDSLLRWLLAVLGSEIDPQNAVTHAREELGIGPRDSPFLLHHRVALIPTSRSRRHIFFSLSPQPRTDIVGCAPANPVVYDEAQQLHVEILSPFEVVAFDRCVVNPERFTTTVGRCFWSH